MPLDVYEQVASQEQDALSESQTLLVERCMTARGFSYPAPASPSNGFVALQQIENDPFGLTDMARAQTYGDAQPNGSGGQGGPQIIGFVGGGLFAGALKNHGQAYTMALFGFGPGGGGRARQPGCYQQAISEVYGPLGGNPNPDPVPMIAVQARQWAQTDPRVLAVERAWSRCMAQRGYSFRTPQQAQQSTGPRRRPPARWPRGRRCPVRRDEPPNHGDRGGRLPAVLVAQTLAALSQLQALRRLIQRSGPAGRRPVKVRCGAGRPDWSPPS